MDICIQLFGVVLLNKLLGEQLNLTRLLSPRKYRLNRIKNFAKEPYLAKLLLQLKSTPVLYN